MRSVRHIAFSTEPAPSIGSRLRCQPYHIGDLPKLRTRFDAVMESSIFRCLAATVRANQDDARRAAQAIVARFIGEMKIRVA